MKEIGYPIRGHAKGLNHYYVWDDGEEYSGDEGSVRGDRVKYKNENDTVQLILN